MHHVRAAGEHQRGVGAGGRALADQHLGGRLGVRVVLDAPLVVDVGVVPGRGGQVRHGGGAGVAEAGLAQGRGPGVGRVVLRRLRERGLALLDQGGAPGAERTGAEPDDQRPDEDHAPGPPQWRAGEGALHEGVGQVRDDDRGEDHQGPVERPQPVPPGDDEGEDHDRPVPEEERVGDVAGPRQPPAGQPPVGAPPGARRPGSHDQREAADRPQRGRAGEERGAVQHEPRGGDQRDAGPAADDAHAPWQPPLEGEQRQHPAERRLPEPRAGVQVGHLLVGQVQPGRPHHRGRRDPGDSHEQHRPHRPAQRPRDQHAPDHHERPHQVELPLHRHRPEVLDRAGQRPRRAVAELGVDELPVLLVGEAGEQLPAQLLPPRLGQEQPARDPRGGQDEHRARQEAADDPAEVAPDVDRPAGAHRLARQHPGEEEAGDRQEDVDAAGDAPVPKTWKTTTSAMARPRRPCSSGRWCASRTGCSTSDRGPLPAPPSQPTGSAPAAVVGAVTVPMPPVSPPLTAPDAPS